MLSLDLKFHAQTNSLITNTVVLTKSVKPFFKIRRSIVFKKMTFGDLDRRIIIKSRFLNDVVYGLPLKFLCLKIVSKTHQISYFSLPFCDVNFRLLANLSNNNKIFLENKIFFEILKPIFSKNVTTG